MDNSIGHIILSVLTIVVSDPPNCQKCLYLKVGFHRAPMCIFQNCCQVDPFFCTLTNLDTRGSVRLSKGFQDGSNKQH